MENNLENLKKVAVETFFNQQNEWEDKVKENSNVKQLNDRNQF